MRLLSLFVVILLSLVSASGETLSVATYNVENYVATNRLVEGVYRENYPKPEAAKAALRAVIRHLDADILAVQEMGPQPYLDELQNDLAKEGLSYPHAVLLQADDKDRHVALLSKRKPKHIARHTDLSHTYFGQPTAVKRGLLGATFETEAGDVTVFVVHLKSRFTDRPDDPESQQKRLGEATAVRERILQTFPAPDKSRFLIVGDFNDSRPSKPLRALMQRGKTLISTSVPATDRHGEVWSHFYRKEEIYSRVDHLLVSPALAPHVASTTAQIIDLPETRLASDHRPLKLTLELSAP